MKYWPNFKRIENDLRVVLIDEQSRVEHLGEWVLVVFPYRSHRA